MILKKLCLLVFILVAVCASAQNGTETQTADYYFQNKEYDKAAELYERFYEKTPSKFYYTQLLATYLELGNYKNAEKLVEKQKRREPKNPALYVDLGMVYLREGKRGKAEKTFDKAISDMGRNTSTAMALAEAFDKIEQYDYALKVYAEMRKKIKNNYSFVFEMATIYEKKGDYESMMAEYLDYLEAVPQMKASLQVFLQRSLTQTNNPKLAESLRRSLASRLQKTPNNSTLLEMMIWFSIQVKDFDFALKQAKAVDMRFPDADAEQVLRVANIATTNGANDVAEQGYLYIVGKGKDNPYYIEARVKLLKVKFSKINENYKATPKELAAISQEYEQALEELGKNVQTVDIMRNYAHILAFYVFDVQKAADMLYDVLEMKGVDKKSKDAVKLELGDILIFGGEMWESALLYMQVEKANKDDMTGALAKLKSAKLSYYKGDFEWAKSQANVLRASTSKLVANDAMELSLLISDNMESDSTFSSLRFFAQADLLIYQNRFEEALGYFDSITKTNLYHALFDEIFMRKAQVAMKQGEYMQADSLLQKVVDLYADDILADDALFLLADLNENKLKNNARAMECYEKIILDYTASLYITEARKRYNRLKASTRVQATEKSMSR